MLSVSIALLQVTDPELLRAIERASDDSTRFSAVLHLLFLEDERDVRFDVVLAPSPILVSGDAPAHVSYGRVAPAMTAASHDVLGNPTAVFTRMPAGGWSVDVSPAEEPGELDVHVVVDRPRDFVASQVVSSDMLADRIVDWSARFVFENHPELGAGDPDVDRVNMLLLHQPDDPSFVMVAGAQEVEGIADAAVAAQLAGARANEMLARYDLRRRRDREQALRELLALP
jgi:hypothetical protein